MDFKTEVELAYPILTNQLSKGRICGQIKAVPLILKAEFQKNYENRGSPAKAVFDREPCLTPVDSKLWMNVPIKDDSVS